MCSVLGNIFHLQVKGYLVHFFVKSTCLKFLLGQAEFRAIQAIDQNVVGAILVKLPNLLNDQRLIYKKAKKILKHFKS